MENATIAQAFNEAISREENWLETGVNWNFVEADMFLEIPNSLDHSEQISTVFDQLATEFEKSNNSQTFAEFNAEQFAVNRVLERHGEYA